MGQVGFEDAATEFVGRSSNAVDRADDVFGKLFHVERAAVGQFAFGQRPNAFVGVEFGGVSRKVLDAQARVTVEEMGEGRAVVGGGIVQQDDDGTAQVAQQFADKQTDFFLADVVEEKQVVQTQTLSPGTDRDAGDDGDLVAAPLAMTHQGCRALGRPGADHQGSQQEARFIGKN
jgi:hypothetical protein